jgi:hypothetical protein
VIGLSSSVFWTRFMIWSVDDAPECVALAHAGDDLGLVLLQLHAGAAAVAALAVGRARRSMAAGSSGVPYGMPSMDVMRHFPCDSPAVV